MHSDFSGVNLQREVEAAFEKEHRQTQLVLFPVRLDDAVMQV